MTFAHTLRHWFHPQRSNNHRPKILHPDALFAVTIFVAVLGFGRLSLTHLNAFNQVLGYASDITASQVVQQTNIQRAQQGLAPLTANDQLNQAALAKAQHMFANQYWAHIAPDGTEPWHFFQLANYKYSVAGENLARDFANTGDMMSAWMASPTHRKNILESRYKDIGVAVVNGTLQGDQTTLVVQLFGTKMVTVPQVDNAADTSGLKPAPAAKAVPAQLAVAEKPQPTPAQQPSQPGTTAPQHSVAPQPSTQPSVLASAILPITQLQRPVLFSPLQLSKAFFLLVVLLLGSTLVYDSVLAHNQQTIRLVGKNAAHIALLLVVAFLLIFFKSGVIG